ncbi:protein FAR-RED IMPAIRED RESPONSE 1-like [Arachis ipaensis]|uniref:protein FAR-RED IMPAIRED RESPONSE 1-like n=1 Tax=Arachis ipaensis TaxID=130454 RepID=UPI0007AF685D|nr:protein FAR-RED IMPAIRED RESPONSE 1-like [Arachis ipaensis]XP_025665158.1 protein FAR-RED IMPAIRED RESPONSE 1-like [Arachis hypogaea]
MKEKNQNFFFELNIEGNHSIKHAFWADVRSRAACEYFGDMISFDTTYNTNKYSVHTNSALIFTKATHFGSSHCETVDLCKYNLVFSSFIGMNHHGQLTLLRCVLIKNEDIQSFKWVFECWLCCMGGKAPKGIPTDQCATMQRTIEMCIPTTIYRWCIWHIIKNNPNKLNGYKRHEEIEQEMSHVVWNSFTKDAFDRNCNDFLTKYSLRGNKWLSTIDAQFQHVYTHEKFREVQAQFREKVNCITRSKHSILGFTTYELMEQVSNSTFNKFFVTYGAVSRELNLLDGGPTIQSSSSFYNALDMNYPREDYTSFRFY